MVKPEELDELMEILEKSERPVCFAKVDAEFLDYIRTHFRDKNVTLKTRPVGGVVCDIVTIKERKYEYT